MHKYGDAFIRGNKSNSLNVSSPENTVSSSPSLLFSACAIHISWSMLVAQMPHQHVEAGPLLMLPVSSLVCLLVTSKPLTLDGCALTLEAIRLMVSTADKPAEANLLWVKNTVLWLQADKFKRKGKCTVANLLWVKNAVPRHPFNLFTRCLEEVGERENVSHDFMGLPDAILMYSNWHLFSFPTTPRNNCYWNEGVSPAGVRSAATSGAR
jgi:hypothetical protein